MAQENADLKRTKEELQDRLLADESFQKLVRVRTALKRAQEKFETFTRSSEKSDPEAPKNEVVQIEIVQAGPPGGLSPSDPVASETEYFV